MKSFLDIGKLCPGFLKLLVLPCAFWSNATAARIHCVCFVLRAYSLFNFGFKVSPLVWFSTLKGLSLVFRDAPLEIKIFPTLTMFPSNLFCLLAMGLTTVLCDKRHSKTSLLGSDVELRCSSSFSPVWFWSDGKRGGMKTLSRDGKNPHPNLDDDRFQFEAGKDVFWLKIKSVRNSDAGK